TLLPYTTLFRSTGDPTKAMSVGVAGQGMAESQAQEARTRGLTDIEQQAAPVERAYKIAQTNTELTMPALHAAQAGAAGASAGAAGVETEINRERLRRLRETGMFPGTETSGGTTESAT